MSGYTENSSHNGDEMIDAENSNSSRDFTTFKIEFGKLLREFRLLWFEKSGDEWSKGRQFFFAFLGSFTYFIGFLGFSFATGTLSSNLDLFMTIAPDVGLTSLVFLILVPAFYAWILAWAPRKTGPVRLYLSGIALPALITTLIVLPFRVGSLLGG